MSGECGQHEHRRTDKQGRRRAELTDANQRADCKRADDSRNQAEFRISLNEFCVAVDHTRDQRRLRDRVRLLHHHRTEDERIQKYVVNVERHHDVDQRPYDRSDLHDHAASARNAVDCRANRRSDHGERRHRNEEIQQHAIALRVGTETEQHRTGERAVHRRITHRHERVRARKAAERRLRLDWQLARPPTTAVHHVGSHSLAAHSRIVGGTDVACAVIKAAGARIYSPAHEWW